MENLAIIRPWGSFFAENVFIVAVCNIAALLAAIWGCYKFSRYVLSLVREVWRKNVKFALRVRRRRYVNLVGRCAADLHTYFSEVLRRMISASVATLGILQMQSIALNATLSAPAVRSRAVEVALKAASSIFVLMILFSLVSLVALVNSVSKIRLKFIRRKVVVLSEYQVSVDG